MNNLLSRRLKYGLISGSILIGSFITIKFLIEYRTNRALQDYSMLPNNVEVIDKVILGRSYPGFSHIFSKYTDHGINKIFRSGAIELVCTNKKNILLVVKGFMHKYTGAGVSDKASLLISFRVEKKTKKGTVEIEQVTFLSEKYFDTIASNPLSKSEKNKIVQALEDRTFDHIGFYTLEGGNSFYGNAEISKVKQFINQCK